jgi:hypothetical protein
MNAGHPTPLAAVFHGNIAEGAMESTDFWRELRQDFLKEAERAFDFHAICVETDLHELADQRTKQTIALIQDPGSHIDAVFSMARTLVGVSIAARESRDSRGWWIRSGAPHGRHQEREITHATFDLLSERAAIGGDLPRVEDGQEHAVQQWLHFLREEHSPYDTGIAIEQLFRASALQCERMINRARRPPRSSHERQAGSTRPRWLRTSTYFEHSQA